MSGFFGADSAFAKYGNLVADMFILSLIWLVFSLPIITAGASTTALYYVMTRRISDREQYLFKDFFKSFKRELKKSTPIWIAILILGYLIYFVNIGNVDYIVDSFGFGTTFRMVYLTIQYLLLIEIVAFTIWVFPVLSRFDLDVKTLIKNSLFMANRHILSTLLCVIIFGAIAFFSLSFPPLFMVFAGLYSLVSSLLIMRVFRKYRPEIDNNLHEINNDSNEKDLNEIAE